MANASPIRTDRIVRAARPARYLLRYLFRIPLASWLGAAVFFVCSNNGRDHNPQGYTMWLAGGGVKPGISFGETDDYGYFAVKDQVHVHDLHATMLRLLGLEHERLTYRYAGRDFRLTDVHGRVVEEIFA